MTLVPSGMLSRALVACLLALSAATINPAWAETTSKQYTATSADSVTLSIQEAGNPNGAPVIFVHGLLGSHLSWQAQVDSPALQRYRLITYDLRGHGQSGSPSAPQMYTDGLRWADDLEAVIRRSKSVRPVLVGWSLGAAVISNYLAKYGDADVAGVVYVGGVVELDAAHIQPHPEVYRDMSSLDLRTRLDAERAFLALCFHRPPPGEAVQRLLANAALASFDMQRAVLRMTVDAAKGLQAVRKPMLQIYGELDALVRADASAGRAQQLNPSIRTIFYPDTGHAPFLESPQLFNDDLAGFIAKAHPGDN
jgi:non-heme chloroperoxidase